MVDVDFTRLTECPKRDPLEEAPNAPATTPTIIAKRIADRMEIFLPKPRSLGATHQGPLGLMLMELFCYNFVASSKPSPVGMSELTQDSVSALIAFPASRRAIVFGSR